MHKETPAKILVVDDDQTFVTALTRFLAGHGYAVITANDAMFAVQYAIKENVAFVILDLGLPCGGGFSVLENLRKTRGMVQLPIIVSTANVAAGVEKQVRDMGADDFILKPYDLERLLELIQLHLG